MSALRGSCPTLQGNFSVDTEFGKVGFRGCELQNTIASFASPQFQGDPSSKCNWVLAALESRLESSFSMSRMMMQWRMYGYGNRIMIQFYLWINSSTMCMLLNLKSSPVVECNFSVIRNLEHCAKKRINLLVAENRIEKTHFEEFSPFGFECLSKAITEMLKKAERRAQQWISDDMR